MRMRFACWQLRLQKHTQNTQNSYCSSTPKMVTRTRLDVALYVHCLYCLFSTYQFSYRTTSKFLFSLQKIRYRDDIWYEQLHLPSLSQVPRTGTHPFKGGGGGGRFVTNTTAASDWPLE
jgi:hypothetical protein